jgi:hypothetical protein
MRTIRIGRGQLACVRILKDSHESQPDRIGNDRIQLHRRRVTTQLRASRYFVPELDERDQPSGTEHVYVSIAERL